MLVNLKEILQIAEADKSAIGMFNATGFDSLQAVVAAAEELKNRRVDNPIILRLILLGFGVAIVLAACVAIMIFLGGEL